MFSVSLFFLFVKLRLSFADVTCSSPNSGPVLNGIDVVQVFINQQKFVLCNIQIIKRTYEVNIVLIEMVNQLQKKEVHYIMQALIHFCFILLQIQI